MELTVEEEKLRDKHDLTDGQLYWRRLKIAEGGELKFKQEYPQQLTKRLLCQDLTSSTWSVWTH